MALTDQTDSTKNGWRGENEGHRNQSSMDWDLEEAVKQCLTLDRAQVQESSKHWTWEECWRIFRKNLAEI